MGGVFLTIKDKNKSETVKKLNRQIRLGKAMGLVDERGKVVRFDPKEQVWVGNAWLHS
jgi:hypothetical protein